MPSKLLPLSILNGFSNDWGNWRFPFCPNIYEEIDWDSIEKYIPWVEELKNTPQDPKHHKEGDVWTHTKMTCEELIKLDEWQLLSEIDRHVLFAAMIFHDVGKPETTKILENGSITSFKHPIIGAKKTRQFLAKEYKENCPFFIREVIFNIVYLHMLPLTFILKDYPMFSTIKSSMVVPNNLLALIALADHRGRICDNPKESEECIEFFQQYCLENDCWETPKHFSSNYHRFRYFVERDDCLSYDRHEEIKGKVIMLSGLPGVGKDYYINNLFDLPSIGTDKIRKEMNVVFDKKEGEIQQELKERCKIFMRKGENFIFNGTNLIKNNRMKWIRLFRDYKYEVEIHYLEKETSTVLKQNYNRKDVVPEKAIFEKIKVLDVPTLTECHTIKYNVL